MQITITEGQLAILVTCIIALITAIIALIRIFWVAHSELSERVLTLEIQQKNYYQAFGELKQFIEKQEENTQDKIDRLKEQLDSLQMQLFRQGFGLPVRSNSTTLLPQKENNQ